MLAFIASCFGYAMSFIYGIVQNYGVAIILFTILVKVLLIPLMVKQQKSMQKVQELQPLYQELQRKYGNDSQRLSLEYQKLLKEKNMNMFSGMGCSGCLLQLIQFPIILGLFYMMVSPLTYILKLPAEEIDGYKEKLNAYYAELDIEKAEISGDILTSGERAEYYEKDYLKNSRYVELVIAKQENLFNMEFLGINLGDIASENRDNYLLYILPVLCMVVTFISLKLSSDETKKQQQQMVTAPNNTEKSLTKPEDEMIMPNMTVMNTMMPIMTGYIAFIAPQGLGLYWTVNSTLQLIQMTVTRHIKNKKSEK